MVSERQDVVSLVAVGDVAVARKDYQLSFTQVAPILRAGDVTFFNSEALYAEKGSAGSLPHGAGTRVDPRKMSALLTAGFNVCTLANNHCLDWGVDALLECKERLEAMGIAVCGAGRNISEARKPAILERKGVKVAFLAYLSVGSYSFLAEEGKPGCAMVRAHTLYEPYDYQPGTPAKVLTWAYKEDLQSMIEDISQAKKQADIVVVVDHWGIHIAPVVIPDYGFEVGHAAIDAGADLVLGTHPHILKGIEVYKGKVIAHSLANFATEGGLGAKEGEVRPMISRSYREMLDKVYGPRHPDQRKSLILKCVISQKKIQKVSYIPVILDEDMANPEPLSRSDPMAQEIFVYMESITRRAGLDTRFSREGNEVTISV